MKRTSNERFLFLPGVCKLSHFNEKRHFYCSLQDVTSDCFYLRVKGFLKIVAKYMHISFGLIEETTFNKTYC